MLKYLLVALFSIQANAGCPINNRFCGHNDQQEFDPRGPEIVFGGCPVNNPNCGGLESNQSKASTLLAFIKAANPEQLSAYNENGKIRKNLLKVYESSMLNGDQTAADMVHQAFAILNSVATTSAGGEQVFTSDDPSRAWREGNGGAGF